MVEFYTTLLEKLTDDAIPCDEIFNHFPLFDETLRHIELWDSVKRQCRQNFSNSAETKSK